MVEGLSLDLSKGTSIHVEHKVIEKLETINSCQVRNISHKVEEKEEVVMGEAVGKDLYSSFQQQEFTDFEIVCEDRNLQCHKVVLAARSPVFRLVGDLNASSNLDIGSPGVLQGNAVE